jgi:hypothetical protein
MFKLFRIPLLVNGVALLISYFIWGLPAAITVAILTVLEISFSFDNAVVNAKILGRMNEYWQRIFLTIGVLIAVFGMRLLFPLIVVALAAHMSPLAALHLALQHPDEYAKHLTYAHPAIAAFGGTFLAMLFLDWLQEEREIQWLTPIENTLFKLGRVENISVIIMAVVLAIISFTLGHSVMVLTSGILGLATYLAVNSLSSFFDKDTVAQVAKAGLATFLYLEVLDASFSFDGVVGAFAVTSNIFLIAIGLGIGAAYIRGLTVYLVRKGTLSEYVYLEHGAHWAIGILAALLLLTIKFDISDIITGLIGVAFIGTAFINSIIVKKRGDNAQVISATER